MSCGKLCDLCAKLSGSVLTLVTRYVVVRSPSLAFPTARSPCNYHHDTLVESELLERSANVLRPYVSFRYASDAEQESSRGPNESRLPHGVRIPYPLR